MPDGIHSEKFGIKKIGQAAKDLFTDVINASQTVDPASIAAAGTETFTITATGAAVGNFVLVAPGVDLAGLIMSTSVTDADTVTVVLYNPTAAAIDLASSTWKAKVLR